MQQLSELSPVFRLRIKLNHSLFHLCFIISQKLFRFQISRVCHLLLSCILCWIESPALHVVLVYDFKDEVTYLSKISLISPKPCDSLIMILTNTLANSMHFLIFCFLISVKLVRAIRQK